MKNSDQLLSSFQRKQLEYKLQQQHIPKPLRKRIEIMLLADEGKTQSEICQTLGCSAATAHRWILFARAQFAHQWQDSPPGRPTKISDQYTQRLQELIQSNPRDYGYPFQRWTANWLNKHLTKELGIELSDRHVSRLLKQLRLSMCHKVLLEQTQAPSEQKSRIIIRNLKAQANSDVIDPSSSIIPINNNRRVL